MTAGNETSVYQDLAAACSKIDRRKVSYQFDPDTDICWARSEQPGLHFGPTALGMLGVDLKAFTPAAADAFQWAYALAVCETFHALEDMVVRFTEEQSGLLGGSRSVGLLCDEELKHMAVFERYADILKNRRPDLAALWAGLPDPRPVLPGGEQDRARYADPEWQHYIFWINALFFEEFTIFLAKCLSADAGLIQPVWHKLHDCHKREEQQHLPTDVVHLNALSLSGEDRSLLSKAFFFRVEREFDRWFGLEKAFALVGKVCDLSSIATRPAFRDMPLFHEILSGPDFRRSRAAAPYMADLAAEFGRKPKAGPTGALVQGHPQPRSQAAHLAEVLRGAVAQSRDATLSYIDASGAETSETYSDLLDRASRIAGGLARRGTNAGDLVVLATDDPYAFLGTFWGCILAGAVPVPLGPPSRHNDTLRREQLEGVWRELGQPVFVTDEPVLGDMIPISDMVLSAELEASEPARLRERRDADEVAFLQFSSGSTGDPQGVVVTHRNVIANISAVTGHLEVDSGDVSVSWMPLHHDMGLCMHLASVFRGLEQTLMSPRRYASRPGHWLQLLSDRRATISATSDSGLAVATRRLERGRPSDLDLSALRCLLIGAEPISQFRIDAFLSAAGTIGLGAEAIRPCYGLAEATTAVTISQPGATPVHRYFSRSSLSEGRMATETAEAGDDSVCLVGLGGPVPGVGIRIAPIDGVSPPAGSVGEIEICGANVTCGYWNDGIRSAELRDGEWVRTGDLGFVCDGQLFLTGRKKDVINLNGRTFHAVDIEERLRLIPEIGGSRLAVAGSRGAAGGEELIVFIQRRHPDERRAGIARSVSASLTRMIGTGAHRVVFVEKSRLPLTTSGKIRRQALREAYERGEFDPVEAAPPREGASRNPEGNIIAAVTLAWADVLGLAPEAIDPESEFFDLGGDSLKAMELHSLLEDQYGRLLDQSLLFEHTTVQAQALFLGPIPSDRVQARAPRPPATDTPADAIAVIAMSARLPGVSDLDEFWQMLCEGRTAFREPPSDRWYLERFFDPAPRRAGKTNCRNATYLDGIFDFDAVACGMTEDAALETDPQQRIFLEVVADLVDQVRLGTRKVGVFAGAAENEYFSRQAADPKRINPLSAHSNLANMLSARISQQMGFSGPALVIDAACATSLVALHVACQSIKSGECELAIAGGIQLNLSEVSQLIFSQAGVLSERGRCTPFARGADGFVPGEGAGAVLLKPYRKALEDDDPIIGVLRGSAINNDGGAVTGMAPNPVGQQEVIGTVLKLAGVAADAISHVETHGAGTPLGDLVEARALAAVFKGNPEGSVKLGSVKSNLGHLFHAAGIASLIKVLLCMKHEALVPIAGCHATDPRFDFGKLPIRPVQRLTPWPREPERPRLAGISAFGVGGTNCHVIVEEPPEPALGSTSRRHHLLCLSAPSDRDLRRVAATFADALEADRSLSVAQFCAAANPRAARFRDRHALVLHDRSDAIAQLRGLRQGTMATTPPKLVFLYPGPGGLYTGMGEHLLEEPAFRDALADCDEHMREALGAPLSRIIENGRFDMSRIDLCQPAIFAFSYAMTRWLESLGISPDAVIGHSGGEYAAAVASGVTTLSDGARLSIARGQAMSQAAPGRMAAIDGPAEQVNALLAGMADVEVACANGPGQTVISGPEESVDDALRHLARKGVTGRHLDLRCAAHSRLMETAVASFAPSLDDVVFHSPRVTFFSTMTGDRRTSFDPDYWCSQLRSPVQFERAVTAAMGEGYRDFIDLGPTGALARNVSEIAMASDGDAASVIAVLRRSVPGWEPTLAALGRLFERGVDLDTRPIDGHLRGNRVLPPYPYSRKHLRLSPPGPLQQPADRAARPAGTQLDIDLQTWEGAHNVLGNSTAPTGLMLDLALRKISPNADGCTLTNVVVERPLPVSPDHPRFLRIFRGRSVELQSTALGEHDAWERHLLFHHEDSPGHEQPAPDQADIGCVADRCPFELPPQRLTDRLESAGMTYGPVMDTIARIGVGDRELLVHLRAADTEPRSPFHMLDPALIDGAMRSVGALTLTRPSQDAVGFVAYSIGRIAIRGPVRDHVIAHLRLAQDCTLDKDSRLIRYDMTLFDPQGHRLAEFDDICLKRLPAKDDKRDQPVCKFYAVEWQSAPLPAGRGSGLASSTLVSSSPGWRAQMQADCGALGIALQTSARPETPEGWNDLAERSGHAMQREPCSGIVLQTDDLEDVAALVRALRQHRVDACAALLVITKSPDVAAFCRSVAHEYPGLNCRAVEVLSGRLDAAQLVAEFDPDIMEPGIAYRNGERLRRNLEPLARSETSDPPLVPGGVYWITGGAGGVGYALALELARLSGARLMLTGRAASMDPEMASSIRAAGGEVEYISCDVTDPAAMRRVHEHIHGKWRRLDGVVHAAADIDDVLLSDRDIGHQIKVRRAKVEGAQILADLTRGDDLRFMVFMSSLVALAGAAGQTDYAAANAALDRLAKHLRAQGRPAMSINWGPWSVGMAGKPEFQSAYRKIGLEPFSTAEGAQAFVRALGYNRPQIAIVGIAEGRESQAARALHQRPAPNSRLTTPRTETPAPAPAASSAVWDGICRVLDRHLFGRSEPLDASTQIARLGVDSLMAVEISFELQDALNVRIFPALILECKTLGDLARRLETLAGTDVRQ